jgi:hypothetical protein
MVKSIFSRPVIFGKSFRKYNSNSEEIKIDPESQGK